jgi:hypothetical protein
MGIPSGACRRARYELVERRNEVRPEPKKRENSKMKIDGYDEKNHGRDRK